MKVALKVLAVATALVGTTAALGSAPVAAQTYYGPVYNEWQPAWDRFEFDRRHVILGTVAAFQPFRLTIVRRNGDAQLIDLKHGTVILPNGATPSPGERIAVIGYYSAGTFIANRIVLRG
ncbi:MAG: hypothetical protein IAI49_08315 [Candidatus Eremiobacteraeota bacterium]|nr:hypothetical protein [Candidatus Eremiobacteraeota bacterium]